MLVGIDVGQKGGLAFLREAHGSLTPALATIPMPELLGDLINILRTNDVHHVFIEKAQAMPGQGVVSMFRYGQHFGEMLGVLQALRIPHTLVTPQTWTRAMHIGAPESLPKERSLCVAQRLWPAHNFLASARSKKPHDGMVDAALICEWGRRHLKMS